jgi:hypothetical protein
MDLVRKLNSHLVARDERSRVLAYSASEDARAFLEEVLQSLPQGQHDITIHRVCPYVFADHDRWYAENEPVLRYGTPSPETGALGFAPA